jgi:hypothetical protein
MIVNIKGFNVLIDDDSYELVMANQPWHIKNRRGDRIYFEHSTGWKKPKIILHRLIINCSKGMVVDHINGDTLDNRRCNLRICSVKENNMNTKRSKRNSTGYKGVTFDKYHKKYRANIVKDGKRKLLGYFDDAEKAYAAYCEANKNIHGEFGRVV